MADPVAPPSADDVALAAECALSLLETGDLDAAQLRAKEDPAFAVEIAWWQSCFAHLADTSIAPVMPPAHVRQAVLQSARGGKSPLRMWLKTTIAGLAGLALAAGITYFSLSSGLLDSEIAFDAMALLNADDRRLRIEAGLNAKTGVLTLARSQGRVAGDGLALQLWVVADGGAPVSLGLVPDETHWQASVPPLFRGVPLSLAISEEPAGGSPTGSPTGGILATGDLVAP